MTRDEVLNLLAGRETNALVTEIIMPGIVKQGEDPEAWSTKNEIWFYGRKERGGILIGEPYQIRERARQYSHSWMEFCPTSNWNHTALIISQMESEGFSFTIRNGLITCPDNPYGATFRRMDGATFFAMGPNVPLAVCRAAIRAKLEGLMNLERVIEMMGPRPVKVNRPPRSRRLTDRDIRRMIAKMGYWFANSTERGPSHIYDRQGRVSLCGNTVDTRLYTRASNM